jgi:hypothetical protein
MSQRDMFSAQFLASLADALQEHGFVATHVEVEPDENLEISIKPRDTSRWDDRFRIYPSWLLTVHGNDLHVSAWIEEEDFIDYELGSLNLYDPAVDVVLWVVDLINKDLLEYNIRPT